MIRPKCQPLVSLLFFFILMGGICQAQQPSSESASGPCAMPAFSRLSGTNIFTEEQQVWLGDIIDDARERHRPVYALSFHVDYWNGATSS